jgi:glycosyltransferase involved in cell wall biosynthesis
MSVPDSKPLVSICVPTYNGEAHLRECLDSLRAQTFRDFEVVITDDTSTDETAAIAREYAQRDARFKFHANPRRLGLVGNWNCGIRLARGEWIKPVFQDDFLQPQCLERMLAVAREKKSRFLACRREFAFAPETALETRQFYAESAAGIDRFFEKQNDVPVSDFAKAIIECVGVNFLGEPTVVLLHRELFDRCGLFNEQLIMCCDSEFWYRAGTYTPVTFVPEILAAFRVHGKSTSAENFSRRRFRMDLLDPLIVLHDFLYAPVYQHLRATSRRYFGERHLEFLFRRRVRQSLAALEKDETCRAEWEAVCAAYPRLREPVPPPGLDEKMWVARQKYSPRRMAGKLLRALGLRK